MLVLLIGDALIHAAHYSEVFGLLAGMRQPQKRDLEPIERPRILVLSASGASTFAADAMLHHLGASVRTVMETDDAERLLDIWRPNVLIITFWSGALGAWCRGLRGKLSFTDLPILVLGDRDDEQEVLEVLDAGADAYLAQPFGAALLVSQVQSFLGRSNWERRTIGDKSTLCVDPIAQRVWIRGQEVHLTRRLFRLMHYLALHPDRMFSSLEVSTILAERNQTMQSNTIAVQIYQLRKTLGVVGADTWLETVRGFSYRLVVPQSDKTPPSSTAHGGFHEIP